MQDLGCEKPPLLAYDETEPVKRANSFAGFRAQLVGFANRMLEAREEAEDAASETILRAVRSDPIGTDAEIRAWLFRTCRRICIDRIRERRKASRSTPDVPVNDWISVTDLIELRAAVGELPAELRLPLTYCDLFGFSQASAAAQLGIPVTTVKSRLRIARSRLQARLTYAD